MLQRHTLLLAVVLIHGLPAGAAEMLTLERAVSLAVENCRGLRIAALDARKAQDRLEAFQTRQFPGFSVSLLGAQQLRGFDFTLQRGVLGSYQGTGPLPSEDVHLRSPLQSTGLFLARVSQPLTGLIRIRRNLTGLKIGVKLADEQTRAAQLNLIREVKRAYYALQQVEASLRSVRETARLYEEVERLTSNYVLQQVALKGDLLAAQTRLAKTQQLEVLLLNQQAAGREQINRLLGRDLRAEFDVQTVLETTGQEPGIEEARSRALLQRPEIRQAELRQLQARQEYRTRKAESIPEVSAEFNSLTLLNYGPFLPVQNHSIGISLTWEPFDWGRRRHESAEKRRGMEQAQLHAQEAEAEVLAEVHDKYRQLQYRRAELRVARLAGETALEQLRVARNKYLAEAVLVKDVLQAQVAVEDSNTEYRNALTSFWNARADFERALGEDTL